MIPGLPEVTETQKERSTGVQKKLGEGVSPGGDCPFFALPS